MDPRTNPYTPNAGATPPALVGRDDQVENFGILLERLHAGRTEQSMIITGLRGVGKTVLLNLFREKAESAGWAVVEMEVTKHDDTAFKREIAFQFRRALFEIAPRERWRDRLQRAARILRSFTVSMDPDGNITAGMGADPLTGVADTGSLDRDLADVLVALGEAAKEHGTGVVLLLDEVQFLSRTQLEAVIMALHRTVQRSLPVTMVGAGLPQVPELAGDAKSYAERLFTFPEIGSLSETDAARAFATPATEESVDVDEDAVSAAYTFTDGYPYFLQELGYAVWSIATSNRIRGADVREAERLVEAKLDDNFFRVRLDRTTQMEQVYLRAMAELGPEPQLAGDVAALMDRTSPQCAPFRSNLVEKGLLYTPEHGYAAFTVPHFDRFLIRTVPDLVVPPVGGSR